jgi:cyclic pyranopterin phosphate synthase
MANVLLTETCVRSCPYCFAKQYMSENDVKDSLSWDNLIYIADFLEGSGERHISLLGGEPLLHPHIAEFIIYLNQILNLQTVSLILNGILINIVLCENKKLNNFK